MIRVYIPNLVLHDQYFLPGTVWLRFDFDIICNIQAELDGEILNETQEEFLEDGWRFMTTLAEIGAPIHTGKSHIEVNAMGNAVFNIPENELKRSLWQIDYAYHGKIIGIIRLGRRIRKTNGLFMRGNTSWDRFDWRRNTTKWTLQHQYEYQVGALYGITETLSENVQTFENVFEAESDEQWTSRHSQAIVLKMITDTEKVRHDNLIRISNNNNNAENLFDRNHILRHDSLDLLDYEHGTNNFQYPNKDNIVNPDTYTNTFKILNSLPQHLTDYKTRFTSDEIKEAVAKQEEENKEKERKKAEKNRDKDEEDDDDDDDGDTVTTGQNRDKNIDKNVDKNREKNKDKNRDKSPSRMSLVCTYVF